MLVTIERIERRQAKNGSYHLVHLGEGRKVYCWDGKLAGELQPGALYEVEVKEGQFPRLVAARPVATQNGTQALEDAPARAQAPVQAGAISPEAYDQRLAALQVVASLAPWVKLESLDQALQAADRVLAWLRAGGG
jgi:hypothetical protein